jgi:phage FluMu gp28-like protein
MGRAFKKRTASEVADFLNEIEERAFTRYQRDYVRDHAPYIVLEKTVRSGITWAHSYKSMRKRVWRDLATLRATNEIFVGKNERTAREYLDYHKLVWVPMVNTFMGSGYIDTSRWTQAKAVYPGGEVEIYSSNPDSFRGVEGDITGDEAAFHEKLQQFISAATSRGAWLPDSQVVLISSHWHPETFFAQIANTARLDPANSEWKSYRITLIDAVNDWLAELMAQKFVQGDPEGRKYGGYRMLYSNPADPFGSTVESIRLARRCFVNSWHSQMPSEEDFQRECMCEPARIGQLITAEEYDACLFHDLRLPPIGKNLAASMAFAGSVSVGIDIGGGKDLTVKWAVDSRKDKAGLLNHNTLVADSLRTRDFTRQRSWLDDFARFPVRSGLVDMGSIGNEIARDIGKINKRIEPTGFNRTIQCNMFECLRAAVQSKRIRLPDDPNIRASFMSVRRDPLPGGGVKYVLGTKHEHGDWFVACAMAVWAAEGKPEFGFSILRNAA